MAIKIVEQRGGRKNRGRNSYKRELLYHVRGTSNTDTAYAEMYRDVMSRNNGRYENYPLESIDVEESEDGGNFCRATVTYSNKFAQLTNINRPFVNFSTKGGTARIRTSRQTLQAVGRNGRTVPNFYGGIGWQGGRCEGVDTIVPAWTKTVSIKYMATVVDQSFERMVYGFTGTVNSHAFLGMNAGECLFYGVDISDSEIVDNNGNRLLTKDLVFEFRGSPNIRGVYSGNIGPYDKDGWDYVWEFYRDVPDFGSKNMIQVAEGIYVERVYDRSDFNIFGF